jgi:F-type H+-transporting ATPase subunit delta
VSERSDAYAAGLAEIAGGEQQLETVADEIYQIARSVEENDELRMTLADRSIPSSRRLGIIEDLLGNRASPLTVNLVNMVVAGDRASELPAIADALRQRAAESKGGVLAEVRSAIPLTEDQQARLAEALGRATGRTVDVQVIVDRSIKGGIVAQVDDEVFDGSVAHKLERLRASL